MIEINDVARLMEAYDISSSLLDKMIKMDNVQFFASIATLIDLWFKENDGTTKDAQEMMEKLCQIQKDVHEVIGLG